LPGVTVTGVKPFLLLSVRPEDVAAEEEYQAFLTYSGLDSSRLRQIRLEREPLGELDLTEWSGILLGGGPFTMSDPRESKSSVQRRVEADLDTLFDRLVAVDFPFLGTCYGIGTLGRHQGAVVDRQFGEPVGPVTITVTAQGRRDDLFRGMPTEFDAFVGHKEAISELPAHAVRLAESPGCPVQAFRVGRRVYAVQFHPELDIEGLCTRVEVYQDAGYFEPSQVEELQQAARSSGVRYPFLVLRRFVDLAMRTDPATSGENPATLREDPAGPRADPVPGTGVPMTSTSGLEEPINTGWTGVD
jgi:GMP synthase (glutamine-hydrolysing)